MKYLLSVSSPNIIVQICLFTNSDPLTILQPPLEMAVDFNKGYTMILSNKSFTENPYNLGKSRLINTNIEVAYKLLLDVDNWDNIDSLVNLLSEAIKIKNLEQKMLCFWDHGSAYGIFHSTPIATTEADGVNVSPASNFSYISGIKSETINYIKGLTPAIQNVGFPDAFTAVESFNVPDSSGSKKFFLDHAMEVDNINTAANVASTPNSQDQHNKYLVFDKVPPKPLIALTMDELATVLTSVGIKPSILLLVNCMMLTIDTLYALKDAADFVVASPTPISLNMFDWEAILEKLTNENMEEIDAAIINDILIESIKNNDDKWFNPRFKILADKFSDRVSFFAVDLTKYKSLDIWGNLETCFKSWAQKLKTEPSFFELLKKVKCASSMNILLLDPDNIYHFRDGFDLILSISRLNCFNEQEKLQNQQLVKSIGNINKTTSGMAGSLVNDNTIYKSKGFTILFPKEKEFFKIPHIYFYYNAYNGNTTINRFASENSWDDFLYEYFVRL